MIRKKHVRCLCYAYTEEFVTKKSSLFSGIATFIDWRCNHEPYFVTNSKNCIL
jgi:hypothetical protein